MSYFLNTVLLLPNLVDMWVRCLSDHNRFGAIWPTGGTEAAS